jgi:hypothetical protein
LLNLSRLVFAGCGRTKPMTDHKSTLFVRVMNAT